MADRYFFIFDREISGRESLLLLPPAMAGTRSDPPITAYLSVPNQFVGLVIGKRGSAVRDIEVQSGATISIAKVEKRTWYYWRH